MFGRLGDIADLMRNAGKIQEAMTKAAEALGNLRVEGAAGGGAVTATVNGRMEMISIKIDPNLLADGDAELLEDMVTAAVNAALVKARDSATQSISSLTGGMVPPPGSLPGVGPFGPGGA